MKLVKGKAYGGPQANNGFFFFFQEGGFLWCGSVPLLKSGLWIGRKVATTEGEWQNGKGFKLFLFKKLFFGGLFFYFRGIPSLKKVKKGRNFFYQIILGEGYLFLILIVGWLDPGTVVGGGALR